MASFAELPDQFRLGDSECSALAQQEESTGRRTTLVDIFLQDESLLEAYFRSVDLAAELLDRLSFLSYAPADVSMISVTVPRVRPHELFPIAIPSPGYQRSRVPLTSQDIESLGGSSNSAAAVALRLFRMGLSASSPYHVMADLWTALEALARQRARDANNFVEHTCAACGAKRCAGPASQQYVREYFRASRAREATETEAIGRADEARQVRGKVVHGSKLHNAPLREEVENQIPNLQSAAAVALSQEFRVKTKSGRCQHLGLPYLLFNMTATSAEPGNFQVDLDGFECRTAISFLPDEFCDPQPFSIKIGILLPIGMDVRGLPAVDG